MLTARLARFAGTFVSRSARSTITSRLARVPGTLLVFFTNNKSLTPNPSITTREDYHIFQVMFGEGV